MVSLQNIVFLVGAYGYTPAIKPAFNAGFMIMRLYQQTGQKAYSTRRKKAALSGAYRDIRDRKAAFVATL